MADNFTGAQSDDWSNAQNWDGGVPTAGDDVVVNNTPGPGEDDVFISNFSANAQAVSVLDEDSLAIGGGGALTTGVFEIDGPQAVLDLQNGGTLNATSLQVDGGYLVIGTNYFNNSESAGSLNCDVSLNSSDSFVNFNTNADTSFANAITGSGNVSSYSAATITLTGANTYSGFTDVNAGVLQIGDGGAEGALGSGKVDVTGTLAFDLTSQTTVANVITGSGELHQMAGIVLLTGANSYDDTVIDSGSALYVGESGTTGTLGTGAVTDNGLLAFARTDALTVSNVISGSGGVQQEHGDLTLSGANQYTGGTTVISGTLTAADDEALGGSSGSVTVDNLASLALKGDKTFANALKISGSGVAFSGALNNLSADNVYNGAVTLATNATIGASGGVLLLQGLVRGTNKTLTLTGAGEIDILDSLSLGSGGLTKNGSGSAFLDTSDSYTGFTTINGGVLAADSGSAIPDAGGVFVGKGAALHVDLSETIGSLGGAGSVVVASGEALTVGGANKATNYSGVISGDGGLTKTGTATLTLSGNNTYAGVTTISSGGLEVLSASKTAVTGSLASSSISIASGAKLIYLVGDKTDNDYEVDATISGQGSVNVIGAADGVVFLAADNNYSGGTFISGGIVDFDHGDAFGSGRITLTGGALRADMFDQTLTNAITLHGTVGLGAGTTFTGPVSVYGQSVLTASENAGDDFMTGVVSLFSATLTISDTGPNTDGATWAGQSLTLSNLVNGSGGITQASSGALVLSHANTYTGATLVTKGVLEIENAKALGSTAAGTTVQYGGTLQLSGGITVAAETLSLAGPGFNNQGALDSVSGSNEYDGAITLAGNARIDSDAGSLTVGAAITGSSQALTLGGAGGMAINDAFSLGSGRFIKDGSGDVQLYADDTFTGGASIDDGVLTIASSGALPGAVAVNAQGNLDFEVNASIGSLAGAGSVALLTSATLTIGGNNRSTVFSGVISQLAVAAVTKVGTGTLTLSGANTYSGATSINAGTLKLSGSGSLAESAVVIGGGATLSVDDHATLGSLAGSGKVSVLSGGELSVGDDATSTTYSGVITTQSDAGDGLIKVGAGTLTLTGTNAFQDHVEIDDGVVSLGSAGALAGATEVDVNAGELEASVTTTYGGELTALISGAATIAAATGTTLTFSGSFDLSGVSTIHFGTATDTGVVDIAPTNSAGGFGGNVIVVDGGTLEVSQSAYSVLTAGSQGLTVGSSSTAATLSLAGGGVYLYNLTGSSGGVVTSTASAATLDDQLSALDVFAGVINNGSNGLSLKLFNDGGSVANLTLTGANTYLGGTSIGFDTTLQLGAGGSTGSILGAVDDQSSLVFDWGVAKTFANIVSGEGEVTQEGAGVVTITGAETYTGVTTIDAGDTLALSGAGSLASSTVSIGAGSTFGIAGVATSTSIDNLTGAGASSVVNLGGKTLVVNDASGAPDVTFKGTVAGGASLNFNVSEETLSFSLASAAFSVWKANDAISISAQESGVTLIGSSQDDVIFGANGNDTLTGGAGADAFDFNSASDGGDVITDFSSAQGDYIGLSHLGFAGLPASGHPTAQEFIVGAGPTLASAQLVFEASSSALYWYAHGTNSSGVELATLSGVTTLSATDIHML